ncbi:hypothetical protein ACFLT7_07320 [candidate division KSB1 bacterium]
MFKKACIGIIALSLISAELQFTVISTPVSAAQERISPRDLAIFGAIAGVIFVTLTYFLAGVDRDQVRAVVQIEEARRAGYVEAHPGVNADFREAILRGELMMDMTSDQVIASWGEPRRKEVLDSVGRVREQWVYYKEHDEYTSSTYYLIFVNGSLKKW